MAHHEHVEHEHETPDAWHQHAGEDAPQAEHGARPNVTLISSALLAMSLVVVVTVVAVIVYFRKHSTDLRRERVETTQMVDQYYKPYRSDADAKLATYSWASDDVAKEGKRVSLPIAEAKKKVIEQYSAKK